MAVACLVLTARERRDLDTLSPPSPPSHSRLSSQISLFMTDSKTVRQPFGSDSVHAEMALRAEDGRETDTAQSSH